MASKQVCTMAKVGMVAIVRSHRARTSCLVGDRTPGEVKCGVCMA